MEMPSQVLNTSSGQSNTQVYQPYQPAKKYLSDVPMVKGFFADNGLPYDGTYSRDKNILDNIERLPTNPNHIYVFENISFLIPDEKRYTFPDNYRLKNCEVVGKGELLFISETNQLEYSDTVRNEKDLRNILDVYYPEKSIAWNIQHAIKIGHWPDTGDITLEEITLIDKPGEEITLPQTVYLKNCDISEGILQFSAGTLTVNGKNAVGIADGSGAKVTAIKGVARAINEAEAFAIDHGKSFALHDGTRAHASGKNAQAFAIANRSIIHVENKAIGFTHLTTAIATKDDHRKTKILMTALHREVPHKYKGIYFSTTKFHADYVNYVLEVKELADLGHMDAIAWLCEIQRYRFPKIIKTGETQLDYIHRLRDPIDGQTAIQYSKAHLRYCEVHCTSNVVLQKSFSLPKNTDTKYYRISSTIQRNKQLYYLYSCVTVAGPEADRAKEFFNIAKEKSEIERTTTFGQFAWEYRYYNECGL